MATYKYRQYNTRTLVLYCLCLYIAIHRPWYCTVYVYILSFTDPGIVLSMLICCHSPTLVLYCLCLYVAIHRPWYCTVYVYMLSFTDPGIVLSMFIYCHSPTLVATYKHRQYNTRVGEWQHINIDSTIPGSVNGNI
jgi:hypothetical protein